MIGSSSFGIHHPFIAKSANCSNLPSTVPRVDERQTARVSVTPLGGPFCLLLLTQEGYTPLSSLIDGLLGTLDSRRYSQNVGL